MQAINQGLAEKSKGPDKKLIIMTIDTDDIDVSNEEAILKDGKCVGHITSGGTSLEVEINGKILNLKLYFCFPLKSLLF